MFHCVTLDCLPRKVSILNLALCVRYIGGHTSDGFKGPHLRDKRLDALGIKLWFMSETLGHGCFGIRFVEILLSLG